MKESPAITVTDQRQDLETAPGSKLAYVAALFKGTLPAWPGATLKLAGDGMLAGQLQDRLERSLGVPSGKIRIAQIPNSGFPKVDISIVYFSGHKGIRKVWVEFKVADFGLPVNVEFEVGPDGAYVEEVKVQFDRLKQEIKKEALRGKVQNIKIVTKIEGLAEFDRERSDKVKEKLKAKIKAGLTANVRLPGTARSINVQLTGALFVKLDETGKVKPGGEVFLLLTIPFDFL